jgi:hypothetical protein
MPRDHDRRTEHNVEDCPEEGATAKDDRAEDFPAPRGLLVHILNSFVWTAISFPQTAHARPVLRKDGVATMKCVPGEGRSYEEIMEIGIVVNAEI